MLACFWASVMYKFIQNLERRLPQIDVETERLNLLQIIAWEYFHHDLPQWTEKFQAASAALAQHPDDQLGLINDLTLAACRDHRNGDFDKALAKASHAASFYQEHNLLDWMWRAQTVVIATYHAIGEYVLLLEAGQKLYELMPRESRGSVAALVTIGMVHLKTEDYAQAFEMFERASAQAAALQDDYVQFVIGSYRIAIYLVRRQYDKAREAGILALQLSQAQDNLTLQAFAHQRLGDIAFQIGDYDIAYQEVNNGLRLMPSERSLDRLKLDIQLAQIVYCLNQHARALNLLREALSHASAMNAKPQIKACHQELASIYKRIGQFELSLYHYEQFHELERNLFNEQSNRRLRTLEVVYHTQQAQAEVELQRGLREQERAHYTRLTKIKDDIVASASHDLKNPLTSISIVLELMQRYLAQDEKAQDYLERLRLSTDKMTSLITDVLDLARFETGHGLEPQPVLSLSFIQNTIHQHEVMALDKNINLKFDAKISDIVAMFDPTQIRRVMDNLISNAIKYTPRGGTIEVNVEQEDDEMVIRIVDTGSGIAKEDLPHVFDRFYRVKNGAKIDQEGTGLGLSIVKSIVEQHGGKIWVASEPEKGSIFSFTLPILPRRAS
jgi:signal transduction histidine kinase